MIKDLNELREAKQGNVTPKALTEDLLENIDNIEQIVAVVKMKNGEILTAYSSGSILEKLGILEIGKVDLIQETYEEE